MPRLKGLPEGKGSTQEEEGLRHSALGHHGVLHVGGGEGAKTNKSRNREAVAKGQTRCSSRTQIASAW